MHHPPIGGGLCQLSNALYDLALKTDCEITERHPHTIAVPGSAAEAGRDATVFWNYIDLRFRPRQDCQIEAFLTADELIVRFHTSQFASPVSETRAKPLRIIQEVGSCVTCGHDGCARHAPELAWSDDSLLTAYVLDAVTPEWSKLVAGERGIGKSHVIVPIDGRAWRMNRYAWPQAAATATRAALIRALRARRYKSSPPAVLRREQLEADRMVALAMALRIPAEAERVVVSQSLLPGLWQSGQLAGRKYDVLMVRLPMGELQRRLDEAFRADPEQRLLGDFRADPDLVDAETMALAAAAAVITPHPGIADLFPGRARLVDWQVDTPPVTRRPEPLIVFPGPTAARKGAFAVREAARRLRLPVAILGSNLEGPGESREGVEVSEGTGWLERAAVVVQPSISEDRPTSLLRALAAGIPIVATDMCGLPEGSYCPVTFGEIDVLVEAIERVCGFRSVVPVENC